MVWSLRSRGRWLVVLSLALGPAIVAAQTTVTAPPNKYSPAQDVQVGQQAATQVEQEFPLVNDPQIQSYVRQIGNRLVAAIPPQFQHPEFHYTFQVVNASDFNAFALPGGPMFVNRGMLAQAKNDGEVAGVMAHELSHVALRHGTAQATKATPYEVGTIAGQILGAIVGGTAGQVIAAGSRFGIGTAFLRFGREYEKEADILGSHIMAHAGYDPRDMAAIFQTIEKGSSNGPQWLSDHPDPGNRAQYITREAELLHVQNAARDTGELRTIQADLNRLPPAQTMAQLEKEAQAGNPQGSRGTAGTSRQPSGGQPVGTTGTGALPPPSASYRSYDVGGQFRVSVPSNWQEQQGGSSVRFAPQGATGQVNGTEAFILGIEMGLTQAPSGDLQQATNDLLQSLRQNNPNLQPQGQPGYASLGGRQGLSLTLSNTSEVGRPEVVVLTTALLDGGNMLYSIGVSPQEQFSTYRSIFSRINQSVQLQR